MIILTDNGSLAPAATLALRALAKDFSARIGEPVHPVSLLHSASIAPELLDGEPAEILEPFLERRLAAGETAFKIIPLFFGPSLALTDYLPKRLAALTEKYPQLDATLAPCLCDDLGGETLVAAIVEKQVRALLPGSADTVPPASEKQTDGEPAGGRRSRESSGGSRVPAVILVDHGSPVAAVASVRDRLADMLRIRLGGTVSGVLAASMERREGDAYAFNEPLLATALRTPGFDSGEVIVAMLFLLPGRHAGPGGDVARICADAEAANPALRTRMTGLVGSDFELSNLLRRRAGVW